MQNFNNKTILITDKIHNSLIDILSKYGFSFTTDLGITHQKLINVIHNFEGVVLRSRLVFDKEIIDAATNLRFIARAGSGMENIDVKTAESKGIICINSPEGNRDSVGEHALGLLLSIFHNINVSDAETKVGIWDRKKNRSKELKDKTVGIIGYGNTGSALAKRLNCLDVNVIAYDKYKSNFSDSYVREVSKNEIFELSDILSLHVPLTKETQYLVNKSFINKFKKNIVLINTSRGPVVNTEHLIDALKTGKIEAAGLDVLEYENVAFESLHITNDAYDFLCKSPNVIITPHIAGLSAESEQRHAEVLAEKILKLL
jgi:D-3-phosphoglycerate dehydrogenase